MPDRIFAAFGKWACDIHEGLTRVNDFLAENEDYEIKNITNVTKPGGSGESFAGVIIVVGERRVKRMKEHNKVGI